MCITNYEAIGSQVQLIVEVIFLEFGSFTSKQLPYLSLLVYMLHYTRCGLDWEVRCEPFPTYPRTYYMVHAQGLLSVETDKQHRCTIHDLFTEFINSAGVPFWFIH